MRKTRANLYLSGHRRYVSMSDADSISPSPRRGMNGSSDESEPAAMGAAPRGAAGEGRGPAALVGLGIAQVVVERAGAEQLALLGGRLLEQQVVDLRQG